MGVGHTLTVHLTARSNLQYNNLRTNVRYTLDVMRMLARDPNTTRKNKREIERARRRILKVWIAERMQKRKGSQIANNLLQTDAVSAATISWNVASKASQFISVIPIDMAYH